MYSTRFVSEERKLVIIPEVPYTNCGLKVNIPYIALDKTEKSINEIGMAKIKYLFFKYSYNDISFL